jgi:electron transfer flavoprotein beta subunit
MNILVIVRSIVDVNTIPQISTNNLLDLQHAKFNINSYDERAVIESIKYKNYAATNAKIFICGFGSNIENIVRNCLARGADEGLYLDIKNADNDLVIANLLVNAIGQNKIPKPDIIFLGVESTNTNNTSLPTMLALLLDFNNIFNIDKINYIHNTVIAINNNNINYKVELNSVISVSHNINTPGFLKLPEIMQAKKKPITKIALTNELIINNDIIINDAYYPNNSRVCKYLNMDELLQLLQTVQQE